MLERMRKFIGTAEETTWDAPRLTGEGVVGLPEDAETYPEPDEARQMYHDLANRALREARENDLEADLITASRNK